MNGFTEYKQKLNLRGEYDKMPCFSPKFFLILFQLNIISLVSKIAQLVCVSWHNVCLRICAGEGGNEKLG